MKERIKADRLNHGGTGRGQGFKMDESLIIKINNEIIIKKARLLCGGYSIRYQWFDYIRIINKQGES